MKPEKSRFPGLPRQWHSPTREWPRPDRFPAGSRAFARIRPLDVNCT
jgi:hypothetical protein